MAKKTAKKTSAAAKKTTTKKAAGAKKPAKKRDKPEEIVLDANEEKAIVLVNTSNDVADELEVAVTEAVSLAVRKVFKRRHISLTASQAQRIALILFGD
jgi:hypothetical protein